MNKLDLNSFNEIVEKGKGISVIKFGADWCGPCKAYAPILEDVSNLVGDKVKFYEVDVDVEQELSNKFNIRSVPATFILKDGKIEKNLMGMQSKNTILDIVNNL